MDVTPLNGPRTLFPVYEQLRVEYDAPSHAIWCYLNPQPRPCMTPQVLQELKDFQSRLRVLARERARTGENPIEYVVGASLHPRFFNLGGDLALFRSLIIERNREALRAYAHDCVEVLHANATNLDVPLTTIAVVQGDALGGGFEAVLSCDVIIIERGARMGFPEILFNLLPGMGGYLLLARRVSRKTAERMMMSGLHYTADELLQMGVVDMVVAPGEGPQAARDFMHQNQRKLTAVRLMAGYRASTRPISRRQMINHTNMWVDAAMSLGESQLSIMERLITHQDGAQLGTGKQARVISLQVGERAEQQEIV